MADVRQFRGFIEELSGYNHLKKQMAVLEKANTTLERELKELKEEIKLFRKEMRSTPTAAKTGKKRGRKSRTMLQIIEAEMSKTKDKQMKVTDIVKALKKKFDSKAKNMYASVAASMNNSDKFAKAAPGVYKLVAEGDAKQPEKKAAASEKKAVGKKAPAKKKPVAKKAPAKKKPAVKKAVAPANDAAAKKPIAKKKAAAKKKRVVKKPAADNPVS